MLERLRAEASSIDMFYGSTTRGAECTHDLERVLACSDVHRVASISLDVDWSPEGLYLPVDSPAFEEYGIGFPGNFPEQGPGYIAVYRWVPTPEEPVTITCGDVVIPDDFAHKQPWLRASDEEVAASGFSHEEVRTAIQEGTAAHRAYESTQSQLGGCPDEPGG
ncbi:MAG: hypothetical protein IT383_11090 [Deltaproteobacteria bacterium]|nr:hypothetical protein [Deltaproteobacteria bacterium]